MEPSAAETYEKNLNIRVRVADLRDLPPAEFRQSLMIERGDLDVLVGCPPCQGFSRMRNISGANDERNSLVIRYLEFVDKFRPKYAFFENVRGMVSSLHGRIFYDMLKSALRDLGYGVAERAVNAADYGVPQHRHRAIVIAGRDGLVPPFPWPTHGNPRLDVVKEGFRKPWLTVRDAIERYQQLGSDEKPNHVPAQTGSVVTEFIQKVPKNGGSRADVPRIYWLACHRQHKGHRDVYGRASWNRPGNTLTGGCTNPSKGRFVHPEEDRGFTFREAAALQGFPDWFVFHGAKLAEQIGNAVPPPLAEAFAEVLYHQLQSRSTHYRSN
jgi:DNA (cytosine-5)-methyltransferase 1